MENYTEQIQTQLDRLGHLRSRRSQRDKTIHALAQAAVDGRSITETLGRDGIVSERAYYSKNKSWYHDPDFRSVLERVTEIYRQRDAEIRAEADEAARRARHEERARLLELGRGKLETLIEGMETADQSPSQVASFLKAIMSEERAEFGDATPTQIEVSAEMTVQQKIEEMERARESIREKFQRIHDAMLADPNIPKIVTSQDDEEE